LRIGLKDSSDSVFALSEALIKRSAPQACPGRCETIFTEMNTTKNQMTTMKDYRHAD
jgi:hypothetical protein